MSTKLTSIVSLAIAVTLAVSSGFLWMEWRDSEEAIEVLQNERDGLAGSLEDLRNRVATLNTSLLKSQAREKSLQATLKGKEAELMLARSETVARPEAAASSASDAGETADRAPPISMVSNIDEANSIAKDIIARGDVMALWGLLADLLSMGEEGYDKIIEIAALVDDKDSLDQLLSLWDRSSIIGAMSRELVHNAEGALRFARYLYGKDESQLPSIVRELHGEVGDELGLMLFGMYEGRDTELLDVFTTRFQQQIAQVKGGKAAPKQTITLLGLIGTDTARDTLVKYAETVPEKRMVDVARSLAMIGDRRALPVLSGLRQRATDPRIAEQIDAAIRFME